jgi:hypothetical protein
MIPSDALLKLLAAKGLSDEHIAEFAALLKAEAEKNAPPPPPPPPPCSLYVIGRADGRPVKVGISASPRGRVYDLQVGNPHRLHLLGHIEFATRAIAMAHERWFHETMADKRLESEWFDMTGTDAIAALKDFVGSP